MSGQTFGQQIKNKDEQDVSVSDSTGQKEKNPGSWEREMKRAVCCVFMMNVCVCVSVCAHALWVPVQCLIM